LEYTVFVALSVNEVVSCYLVIAVINMKQGWKIGLKNLVFGFLNPKVHFFVFICFLI